MNNEYSLVITACPDKGFAKKIAGLLVEQGLAACVQMLPVESVYLWQGKICNENEIALFIKTKTEFFHKIKDVIKENHSYEIPEIIQVPITDGLPEYLKWIDECVKE